MNYIGKHSVASFLRVVLNIIWGFGIAMIVLLLIFTSIVIAFGPLKGIAFHNGPNIEFPPHPRYFTLDTDFLQIEFRDAVIKNPKKLFLAFFPFGALMIGLGMAIIYQLRKIFTSLTAGNPFVLENAKRIRKIGLLIFGGVVVQLITGAVIGRAIMENVIIKGISFNIKSSLNLGGIFIGLVILMLAEIFRQGALLKEEQDLTI